MPTRKSRHRQNSPSQTCSGSLGTARDLRICGNRSPLEFVEAGEAVLGIVGDASDHANEVAERLGAKGGAHGDAEDGVVSLLSVKDHIPCSEFESGIFTKEEIGGADFERALGGEGERGNSAHLDTHELASGGVYDNLLGTILCALDIHDDIAAGINLASNSHFVERRDDALIGGWRFFRLSFVFVVHWLGIFI